MGVMTPGKIHPSHNCLYVSFGGYEYRYKHNYEILVSRGPCEWISETKGTYFFSSFYKEQKWYFVIKIVLTYCEKNVLVIEKKTFEIRG